MLEHPSSVFEYDEYLEPSELWKKLEYTATGSLPMSSNLADSTAMFLPSTSSINDLPNNDLNSSDEEIMSVVTTSSFMALESTEVVRVSQSVQSRESLISSVLLEPTSSVSIETNELVDMIMSAMKSSVPVNTQFERDSSKTIISSSTYSGHVSLETSYLDISVQPLVEASSDDHMAFAISQSVIGSEVKVTSQPITEEADILTTNISLVTKVSMLSDIVLSTSTVMDEKFDSSFATESSFRESMSPGQEYSFNSTIPKLTSSQYFVDRMMTSMIIYPSISVSSFPINVSSSNYSDFIAFPSTVDYSMTINTLTNKVESYDETPSSMVMFYSETDSSAYLNTDSIYILDLLPILEPSARSFPHSMSILSLVETDTVKIEATMNASESDFHFVILSNSSVTDSDIYQQEFSTGHIGPDGSTSRIAGTDNLSESYDFQIDATTDMSEDYSISIEISPSNSFIDESFFEMTPWFTENDFFQSELAEMTSLFDESIFDTVSSSLIFSEITSMIASTPVVQVMSTQTISIDATVPVQSDVKNDITVMIVLDGDCSILTGPNTANHNALTTFSLSFKLQLESILYLSSDSVYINEITCGSVHVLVTITNATDALIKNQLWQIIVDQKFIVSVNYSGIIENFTAVKMDIVQNATRTMPTPIPAVPGGIDDIDVIVIIVACCICAVLLVLGVIICVKQWYRKTRAQSFDLIDTPHVNLKMEDFTLTRIPRPRAIYNEGGTVMTHSYSGESNGRLHHKTNGHQSTPSEAETLQLNDISIEGKSLQSVAKSNVSSASGSNRMHPRESIASSSSSIQANDLTYCRSSEALVPHSDSIAHGSVNPIYSADDESATSFVSNSDNTTKDDSSQQ